MRVIGPVVDPVPCSGCGVLLDPIRAGHIAIFDGKLHCFCNRGPCREAYLSPFGGVTPSPTPPERTLPPPESSPIESAHSSVVPEDDLPLPPRESSERAFVEPIDRSPELHAPVRAEPSEERNIGLLLLLLAVVAGSLALVLGVGEGGRLANTARLILVSMSLCILAARVATSKRSVEDVHPVAILIGPIWSLIVAWIVVFRGPTNLVGEALALAATAATGAALSMWMLDSVRKHVEAERSWLEHALGALGRRIHSDGRTEDEVESLKPTEHILVEEGEDVAVDLVVSDGEAEVFPWAGSTTSLRRRVGDPVAGGAHVLRGRLVGVVTAVGPDRVFSRSVLDSRRRIDVLASVSRKARSLVERWSGLAAIVAGLLAFAITRQVVDGALVVGAVLSGLASASLGVIPSVHVARGALLAQRRGIAYRSADAWERAAKVTTTVFCARGTLLLGEPEVAEVIAVGTQLSSSDVLAIASGAARSDKSPVFQAILRAAKTREVKPDAVRSPSVVPGQGVVSVTSGGEELIVGSRSHLLEHRIGVATAEWQLGELESMGRTVILVALGGRLQGIVALQDGIRGGARAAIQHLLDERIELVLMSGDSRETCDAIARSLDIEHVRAEVLPQERGQVIKALSDGGDQVAVMGHPAQDDLALASANVSIAMNSAGIGGADLDILIASDDLRDGALALALAKQTREEAGLSLGLLSLPPALGALVVALGVLPPIFMPIAAFLGALVGTVHFHALERKPARRAEVTELS